MSFTKINSKTPLIMPNSTSEIENLAQTLSKETYTLILEKEPYNVYIIVLEFVDNTNMVLTLRRADKEDYYYPCTGFEDIDSQRLYFSKFSDKNKGNKFMTVNCLANCFYKILSF